LKLPQRILPTESGLMPLERRTHVALGACLLPVLANRYAFVYFCRSTSYVLLQLKSCSFAAHILTFSPCNVQKNYFWFIHSSKFQILSFCRVSFCPQSTRGQPGPFHETYKCLCSFLFRGFVWAMVKIPATPRTNPGGEDAGVPRS